MFNWVFQELEETESTQKVAKALAAEGAPEGTTVVARSQSSGTGRTGRPWESPVGGLYMSFILRPGRLPRPEAVSLVSATAIVLGIQRLVGLPTVIRWPNDVMYRTKKLGGVISEAEFVGGKANYVIAGIGVNCNTPTTLAETTSLIEELGTSSELSELRDSILDSFSTMYADWQDGKEILQEWKKCVGTIGKHVTVKLKSSAKPLAYAAVDVNSDGELVVTDGQRTFLLRPEAVEWLRENS